jgi:hypothetical protein
LRRVAAALALLLLAGCPQWGRYEGPRVFPPLPGPGIEGAEEPDPTLRALLRRLGQRSSIVLDRAPPASVAAIFQQVIGRRIILGPGLDLYGPDFAKRRATLRAEDVPIGQIYARALKSVGLEYIVYRGEVRLGTPEYIAKLLEETEEGNSPEPRDDDEIRVNLRPPGGSAPP